MSDSSSPPSISPIIGFVGAGQMGGPMVDRLLGDQLPVRLFARRSEVAQHFESKGAVIVPTLAELAAQCDVILVCLFSDAQLVEVALGDGGLLRSVRPGAVVASHTTGSVKTIQHMAQVAAARGAEVLDAPVSGTAADIQAGRLAVLLGGSDSAAEHCAIPMNAYSRVLVRVGQVGDATKIKLLNNALFTAQMRLALDVMRLATDLGVDPQLTASALRHCSGDSYAMGVIEVMGAGSAAGAEPFLVKDVAVVRAVAAELGADLGLLGETAGDGRLTG